MFRRISIAALAAALGLTAQTPPPGYVEAVKLHQAGRLEEAAAAYRAYLTEDPNRPEAETNLGAALAALGRYEEAIAAYDRALAAAPSHPAVRRNRALALFKSARLAAAAGEFAALRQTEPEDLALALLEADARFRLGDEAAVVAILEPLASERPDDAAIAYLLGAALIRSGRVEEGRRWAARVLGRADSAEARLLMGLTHVEAGDMAAARREFERALVKNPELPGVRSHLGKTLLELGERAAAAESFRQDLARDPLDYDSNFFLGVVLREDGQTAEALPWLERAAQLRPAAAAPPYQIALAQMALERYADARATLEALLARAPEFAEAHVSLATVYFRLGLRDEAQRQRELARQYAR